MQQHNIVTLNAIAAICHEEIKFVSIPAVVGAGVIEGPTGAVGEYVGADGAHDGAHDGGAVRIT